MSDKEILLRLLQTAYTDDALTQPAKAEFEKFVIQFDEEGEELEFPLNDLDLEQEKILRILSETGYTTQAVRYHGTNGGHILHVNLRGEKFLELANGQVRTVVFGLTNPNSSRTIPMKSDLEILQQLHEELKSADPPPFDVSVIDFYGGLIGRVPEDGYELIFPDKDLPETEEAAIRQLKHYGYVKLHFAYRLSEGYIYQVNLRGKRFFEIADRQFVGMQDSGKREEFETGAVRDTADGKARPDLISPFATEKLAHWLRLGAEKYAARNWERGIPLSRCLASAQRHLLKYQQGAEDGEDHLTAAYCNIMFMIHTVEMIKRRILPESLDDLPRYSEIPRVHFNGDEPIE
jgi:hypothetical protein